MQQPGDVELLILQKLVKQVTVTYKEVAVQTQVNTCGLCLNHKLLRGLLASVSAKLDFT